MTGAAAAAETPRRSSSFFTSCCRIKQATTLRLIFQLLQIRHVYLHCSLFVVIDSVIVSRLPVCRPLCQTHAEARLTTANASLQEAGTYVCTSKLLPDRLWRWRDYRRLLGQRLPLRRQRPALASENFFFSTPWFITTARSRPTAFITVTRRCAGALIRKSSLE